MFGNCYNLVSLDLSSFNTQNVEDMSGMFQNCNKLVTIKSNEKGEFYNASTNEIITGNIDFNNGKCNLTKNTIKSKSQITIATPTKTPYSKAYNIIDEYTNKWYSSYDSEQEPSYFDEIIADEYDTTSASNYFEISLYREQDDKSFTTVYSYNNDENYYMIKTNDIYNSEKIYINKFVAVDDSEETALYSSDNGKTLYLNLANLKNSVITGTPTNELNAYVDLGEATGKYLYSTDNGAHMYIDVANTPSKEVTKWSGNINGKSVYGYKIGSDSIYYSDLSFTSILTYDDTPTQVLEFNKMEMIIKTNNTELKLDSLKIIKNYNDIYTIDYIPNFTKTITVDDVVVEIVKESMTFNYWIEVEGELKKFTATINANGSVSGINIASGSFDYTTNVLSVTFVNKVSSEIVISFEYYYTLDIDASKSLMLNYKIEKAKINEIGLEDENHELLAYMTFPDIEFHDIYNNVSAMFAINKSN